MPSKIFEAESSLGRIFFTRQTLSNILMKKGEKTVSMWT